MCELHVINHLWIYLSNSGGLGFPLAMLVAVISLSTGAVLEWVLGPCRGKHTGEQALFRELMPRLQPGDIVLADRAIARAQVELSAAQAMGGASRSDPGEGAWGRLRFCESGGVYSVDTGNGFYGAYQFDLQTWQTMGGTGRPSDAPYWEQDLRAKALFQTRGAQPWPVCGRFLG